MIKYIFILLSNLAFFTLAQDTLFLNHTGSEIAVIEGEQNKYFDLNSNLWDSILSGESTDENEWYINILVKIDHNPFTGNYSIKWISQGGRMFQSVEVDCLKSGCGSYYYWSESCHGFGFLKNGMKNGIETRIDKSRTSITPFRQGFISGTECIYHQNTGNIEERYYSQNKRGEFTVWYKYEGVVLNFFDYVGDSSFKEGINSYYSKKRKSTISFEIRNKSIIGEILLKDRKRNKYIFHVF